jgi:enoyl-CoA hydratase/carnithine racemase
MDNKWPYKSFILDVKDGIATIRLNRPKQLNALTFQVYEELARIIHKLLPPSLVL